MKPDKTVKIPEPYVMDLQGGCHGFEFLMKIFSYLFLALTIILVIVGRVKTFHMTEGEALVDSGYYWIGAMVCALFAILLKDKKI